MGCDNLRLEGFFEYALRERRNKFSGRAVMRILVVDDDAFVREMIAILIQGTGLSPVDAVDGIEAIAEFEKQPFRIAMVDMLMPSKDGIETIMELRRRWPATRIIAMSGGSRFIHRYEALDWAMGLGANDVLPKPFDPLLLVALIENQLSLAEPPGAFLK